MEEELEWLLNTAKLLESGANEIPSRPAE